MKIRDAISIVEKDGWRSVAQKGSQRQFKIAGALSDELAPGTPNSILKQARLRGRS